jgi:hypothetical protein
LIIIDITPLNDKPIIASNYGPHVYKEDFGTDSSEIVLSSISTGPSSDAVEGTEVTFVLATPEATWKQFSRPNPF